MPSVAIIGAGPAGMAAARALVEGGLSPILVDEAERPGGQIWRQAGAPVDVDWHRLLGRAGARAHARAHAAFAAVAGRIDHRPRHLAWTVQDGEVFLAEGARISTLRPDALLLATGATDRLLPVPGWTLPGAFALGGAQVLLKDQGAAIGRRVVFAGASPLLHLAALQYRAMGVEVAAVLDSTRLSAKLRAAPALARAAPGMLARGLAMMARLRAGGVPLHSGVAGLSIEGSTRVEAVRFRDGAGTSRTIACDAVALGFGLRPETQLADLAGASLRYDPGLRLWLPLADPDGRAAPGLYVAGDGAVIGGAEAAELGGKLAALAILADLGHSVAADEQTRIRQRLRRLHGFQRALARAFAWPAGWLATTPAETILCRCEAVTLGAFRAALEKPLGPREINRAKALSRCGMGRCQARFCGPAMTEAMAQALDLPAESLGRLRGQAPVKPIPLAAERVEDDPRA